MPWYTKRISNFVKCDGKIRPLSIHSIPFLWPDNQDWLHHREDTTMQNDFVKLPAQWVLTERISKFYIYELKMEHRSNNPKYRFFGRIIRIGYKIEWVCTNQILDSTMQKCLLNYLPWCTKVRGFRIFVITNWKWVLVLSTHSADSMAWLSGLTSP